MGDRNFYYFPLHGLFFKAGMMTQIEYGCGFVLFSKLSIEC